MVAENKPAEYSLRSLTDPRTPIPRPQRGFQKLINSEPEWPLSF